MDIKGTDMDKRYKANWKETKGNFAKWWRGESLERPLLFFNIKEPAASKARYLMPETPEIMWTGYKDHLEHEIKVFSNTEYITESYPNTCARLGPGTFGTFLGSIPEFEYNTVWYKPCFDDISRTDLKIDRTGWYAWSLENTKYAVERSKGSFLVSFSDFVENLDTLAQVFGPEKVLYYLYDAPGDIHRLQKQMLPLWYEAFDEHYNIIKDEEGWSSYGFFNLWAPGKVAKLQCDISACLSPAMFDEFVLPYLKDQCDWLDHSIYHLDGPDALCHLDSLLGIDSLNCINWVSGAGNPCDSDECWYPMYKKILDAGKSLHLFIPAEKVPKLIRDTGSSAIYIQTAVQTVDEANSILKENKIEQRS